MNKLKNLTKPNKLFEIGPDWVLDKNHGHWTCQLSDKLKAFIWEVDLSKPDDIKLSKSNTPENKIVWDGFCIGIPGGPEPSKNQSDILNWIRDKVVWNE